MVTETKESSPVLGTLSRVNVTGIKVQSFSLDEFDVNREPGVENVRDLAAYTPENVQSLVNDLQTVGQTEPMIVYRKPNGKLGITRGFRRFTAMEEAGKRGLKFEGGRYAGKPMDVLDVQVLPDTLSATDRIALMFDHSQRRGFNAAELQRSVEACFKVQLPEKQIAILFQDLITLLFPPKRDIVPFDKDGGADLLNYYRGTIQTMKRAFDAPDCVHELWMQKLATGKGITKGAMETLSDVHLKEMSADTTGKINKKNPGPVFMEKWAKLQSALNTPTGNKSKPGISMRNRQQTEDALKGVLSRCAKLLFGIQLGNLPIEVLPIIDAAILQLEASPGGAAFNADIDRIVAEYATPVAPQAAAPQAPQAAAPQAAAPQAEESSAK